MEQFQLFGRPWWVNLVALVPLFAYLVWRRRGLSVPAKTLVLTALFGAGFGFVEAAAVVYLRAAVGLVDPALIGNLEAHGKLSGRLFAIELVREIATLVALVSVALLAAPTRREPRTTILDREATPAEVRKDFPGLFATKTRSGVRGERWAMFLWTFAIWDLAYYAGLWATVRWPPSLTTPDVLFLIPVPWLTQVWFPLLVSSLTLMAVLAARRR